MCWNLRRRSDPFVNVEFTATQKWFDAICIWFSGYQHFGMVIFGDEIYEQLSINPYRKSPSIPGCLAQYGFFRILFGVVRSSELETFWVRCWLILMKHLTWNFTKSLTPLFHLLWPLVLLLSSPQVTAVPMWTPYYMYIDSCLSLFSFSVAWSLHCLQQCHWGHLWSIFLLCTYASILFISTCILVTYGLPMFGPCDVQDLKVFYAASWIPHGLQWVTNQWLLLEGVLIFT